MFLREPDRLEDFLVKAPWLCDQRWRCQSSIFSDNRLPAMQEGENVMPSDKGESCNIESDGALATSAT